ncbi:MAG: pullulanase-type alpha-1,6-glucosidase [Prochlorothrix sp.]
MMQHFSRLRLTAGFSRCLALILCLILGFGGWILNPIGSPLLPLALAETLGEQGSGVNTWTDRKAIWLDRETLAWNTPAVTYELHHNSQGNLIVPDFAGQGIQLTPDHSLDWGEYAKYPNLIGYTSLKLPLDLLGQVPNWLKEELAIAAYDDQGRLTSTTGVQLQGVLDDLFAYDGDLGVIYDDQGNPTLKVWAPTAQQVNLYRFESVTPESSPIVTAMNPDPNTGVWSITGDPSWDRQFYRYEVTVYFPDTGQIEVNQVTDPYSISLSSNSKHSQILNLADADLKPEDWDTFQKPALDAPEDMVLYEVHVRDFSNEDQTVAAGDRGTFKAFTYDGFGDRPLSNGMRHLQNLAQAGLTHIHLMPAFDIASINEDPEAQVNPNPIILDQLGPASKLQQAIVGLVRGMDSFNWGYDPYHYGVPEGSYATDPNGATRVLEFREMVKSLSDSGLRVILDVVYNHTSTSALYPESVFDKVVPGYYYRLTNDGYRYTASCCPDTATEFHMMNKLMVDTAVRWAKAYKVDGFRFDFMSFHTADNLIALQDTLHSLTPERDGVDGSKLYLYGEGWDYGSAQQRGFRIANQYNMAGTGIGTFNDRPRESIFGGFDPKPEQGFINGQSYDWNGYDGGEGNYRRSHDDLLFSSDRIRAGLAGGLKDFSFIDRYGQVTYSQNLGGYTEDPQESVNYLTAHDNETLFDLNVYKLPMGKNAMGVTPMADRVRVQNLGLSIIGLSQGIPFFPLGTDMLRSKSLDHNSYDSGDWFNRVDFTYRTNHFGSGLPPVWNNQYLWLFQEKFLGDPRLTPAPEDIEFAVNSFQEILKIRKSSKLFRLETAKDIQSRLRFYNNGPAQRDAVIVMAISDQISPDLDPDHEAVVVVFNANKFGQEFPVPELRGFELELHPVQQNSIDPVVRSAQFNALTGTFNIPARTTAVFVMNQEPIVTP